MSLGTLDNYEADIAIELIHNLNKIYSEWKWFWIGYAQAKSGKGGTRLELKMMNTLAKGMLWSENEGMPIL